MTINQAYVYFIKDFAKKSLTWANGHSLRTTLHDITYYSLLSVHWMEEPRNLAWIGLTPLASQPRPTEAEAETGMFLGGNGNAIPAGLINSVMQQAVQWRHLWWQHFRITQDRDVASLDCQWNAVGKTSWPCEVLVLWCHSLSLASVKSSLVLPFWYRPTRVVPDKGPLNVCVCVCVCDAWQSPSGRGQGQVYHFYILGPRPYLWSGWSQTFQIWFADWTQRVLALHMLKFGSMGVHLHFRGDLLKFWEMSANISETVPERHIHCESKKTRHLTLAHNFTKYLQIFEILSLLDSVGNL